MTEKIDLILKNLPDKPGSYQMYDEYGNVLYVGKAKNLKNRVRQYFHGNNRTQKTLALVAKIKDIHYIITPTELDALVLENNLIKQYNPPYNIMLKDDKTYPYIKINLKSPFPTVEVTRRLKADGGKYFGPYMLGIGTKELLELIHSAFPLRECNNFSKEKRACLNYHIGRCLAPCVGKVTREEYADMVKQVIRFLSGSNDEIEKSLRAKMLKAAEDEEFEAALKYKEMLSLLDKIVRKQGVPFKQEPDIDIFSFVTNGVVAVINQTAIRGGKLLGSSGVQCNDLSGGDILSSYIMQHYERNPVLCTEVLTNVELDFSVELADYISAKAGRRVNVYSPQGGIRRQMVDVSVANTTDYLEKQSELFLRKEELTLGGVNQLKELLSLKNTPFRIECYDISHIQGTNTVSSMVVFINGESAKKHYRHFKIETVKGIDDFASMRETLGRRLARYDSGDSDISFSSKPDLIVIDGGKGQLSFAEEALEASSVKCDIISLAKRIEEVFLPGRSESIILPRDSLALKLLVRVRDEAHRFAITYHRRLRDKQMVFSELRKIEGVGKERATAVSEAFPNYDAVKKASADELAKIDGIPRGVAERIYNYFKKKSEENDEI